MTIIGIICGFVMTIAFAMALQEIESTNKTIDRILKGEEKNIRIIHKIAKKVENRAMDEGMSRELFDLANRLAEIEKECRELLEERRKGSR